jgi:hypothetical protein
LHWCCSGGEESARGGRTVVTAGGKEKRTRGRLGGGCASPSRACLHPPACRRRRARGRVPPGHERTGTVLFRVRQLLCLCPVPHAVHTEVRKRATRESSEAATSTRPAVSSAASVRLPTVGHWRKGKSKAHWSHKE